MLKKSISLLLGLTSVTLISTTSLAHHAGGHPTRYVAQSGVDNGSCAQASAPCKTLGYVISQAGKGDKIHVAEGSYSLEATDIFYLLSDMVIMQGGYKTSDKFAKASLEETSSEIVGIPAEYREQLAKKGFRLIQDQKKISALDEKTLEELNLFKKLTSKTQSFESCNNGSAAGFPCNNINLQSHMPLSSFSSNPGSINDIWGFVDLNDSNEYALVGLQNGTAIVNVTNPKLPVEVGFIAGNASIWRDLKVYQFFDETLEKYQAYAYVTTESNALQGLQIIDLTKLPTSVSLAQTLTEFTKAHNVYIANVDYATGMANEPVPPVMYIAGANKSGGAYRVFGLNDPLNPTLIASNPNNDYVHDMASMVITDSRTSQCAQGHNPCEILVDFNETTVDLWDVTDKNAPFRMSRTGYANTGFTHSGWVSEDKKYVFVQDEIDEQRHGLNTTLRVMDINDLTQPFIAGIYSGKTKAIDHNGFVKGDKYYMSNYRRGLTILDIKDPTNPSELGFFDTFPTPSANSANFNGAWGTYPYLPSGNILISDVEFGFFVVKPSEAINNIAPVITAANSLTMIEDETINIQLSALTVEDVDNSFPTDFTLKIQSGDNYQFNGTVVTPAQDFSGSLSVSVRVNDGLTDSNSFDLTINVTPVNDVPIAFNDSFTLEENSSSNSLTVLSNDIDVDPGDNLSIQSINYSGEGSVENLSTSINYTPATNFTGTESLEYTVMDNTGEISTATVTITVNTVAVQPPPPAQSAGGGGSSTPWMLLLLSLYGITARSKSRKSIY